MKTQYNGDFLESGADLSQDNAKKAIIDKVSKLLELANSTPHSEEAATAKNMAASLLAKHNMSIGDLQDEDIIKVEEFKAKRQFNYTKSLYDSIGSFTGVAFLYSSGNHPIFFYVGKRENIEAFRYMLSVVISQMERQWEQYEYKHRTTKQRWCLGFAYGVDDKCKEIKKAAENKVSEKGLVLIDEAAQALANYKKSNKVKPAKLKGTKASYDGYQAGKNVSLNKGVEAQSEVRRIA